MSWYEVAPSEEKEITLRIERRRRIRLSIEEAARRLAPDLERLHLTADDVYTIRNVSLMGWPVPEPFRHYQGTHVAGEIVEGGMRNVLFLARETPVNPHSAVVDMSEEKKPLFNLNRYLVPPPFEKEQERAFQIWFSEVKKDSEWFLRPAPAYSLSFSWDGMPDGFQPDSVYFEQRIKEEWYTAAKRTAS